MQRVRLFISGFVQRVGFRHATRHKAQELGLIGWVRNAENGEVEVVAEGEKEELEELVKWCHQGPPAAQVEKVDVDWQQATREFQGFEIKF